MSRKPRNFKNRYPDFSNQDEKQILPEKDAKIYQERIDVLIDTVLRNPSDNDVSIYTGNGGICVLLLRLYSTTSQPSTRKKYLDKAKVHVEKILGELPPKIRHPEKEVSFVEGYVGIFSVAAAIYHCLGNEKQRDENISELLSFRDVTIETTNSNELLYGRTGYIHALLYAYKYTKDETLLEAAEKVAASIVAAGRSFALDLQKERHKKQFAPLMYQWHDKRYLGFAHGMSGILSILLLLMKLTGQKEKKLGEEFVADVHGCLDFIKGTVFPNGNYPTRDDGTDDALVQWCHGAPGIVLMYCVAFEVLGKQEYLDLAVKGCDIIWERGILRKGFGLCHGISGNAYPFLAVYKHTNNPLFLYRAVKFSDYAWDDKQLFDTLMNTPDEPYSLFGGLGGAAYLNHDLLQIAIGNKDVVGYFPTIET